MIYNHNFPIYSYNFVIRLINERQSRNAAGGNYVWVPKEEEEGDAGEYTY